MNKHVLQRFVKDYNLPISIFQEPYFSYFIDLYEDTLGSKTKFEALKEALEKFETDDEFLAYYYKIRERIITKLNENEDFQEFNTGSMDKYNVKSTYPKGNIYKGGNENKYYVSIDLVKANYQALRYVNKTIVLNTDSYQEFLGEFTDSKYLINSKYLRQVIFGNVNPKRQIKVQRYMMELILNNLLENNIITEDSIRSVSNDEIVFEINSPEDYTLDLVKYLKDTFGFNVDVEVFLLENFLKSYYVKKFVNKDGAELMCVPQYYYAIVFKKFYGLELNEKDLTFFYEGKLARFIELKELDK